MPTKNASIWKLTKNLPESFLVVPFPYEDYWDLLLARVYNVDYCFFLPSKERVKLFFDKIGGDCQFDFTIYDVYPVLHIKNNNGIGGVTVIRGVYYQFEDKFDNIVTFSIKKWIQRLSNVEGCVCYDMRADRMI